MILLISASHVGGITGMSHWWLARGLVSWGRQGTLLCQVLWQTFILFLTIAQLRKGRETLYYPRKVFNEKGNVSRSVFFLTLGTLGIAGSQRTQVSS
jgi:hypothetical protein